MQLLLFALQGLAPLVFHLQHKTSYMCELEQQHDIGQLGQVVGQVIRI